MNIIAKLKQNKWIKTRTVILLLAVFLPLVFVSIIFVSGCGNKTASSEANQKALYYCPMHPSYTSDRPGDCPICNMKLVKKATKTAPQKESAPAAEKKDAAVNHAQHGASSDANKEAMAGEKPLEEICIEHQCTMKDCPMRVRANLKPGERIICPVCGEFITTTSGKLVEVGEGKGPAAPQSAQSRKILFYRNPMNPEVTSPVPAKDQMGMDYIPVYEGETSGQGVQISLEKQELIGVKTEAVQKRKLTKTIRAVGKIAYDPELAITQEEFVQALNNLENVKESPLADLVERTRALVDASRRKLRLLGMSDEQIVQLESEKKVQTNLYLPSKGENVWAYLAVYEYEIGAVKEGMPVRIEAVAYPGEMFEGKVSSISPVLDATTRTNQVRVEVINTENKLKPEMFVNTQIDVDLGEKLTVPDSAVLDTGMRTIVYVIKGGDLLEGREVTLGQHAGDYYEVFKGLSEGELVVTSGNFFIDSESRLKAAISGESHQHGQ